MTEYSKIDERMVQQVQPQQSPKTLRMRHKRYRLYRTGHIATISRKFRTKKSKCDETEGLGAPQRFGCSNLARKGLAWHDSHCNLTGEILIVAGVWRRNEFVSLDLADPLSNRARE